MNDHEVYRGVVVIYLPVTPASYITEIIVPELCCYIADLLNNIYSACFTGLQTHSTQLLTNYRISGYIHL